MNYTSNSLRDFAEFMGYNGEPFYCDPIKREKIRAKLDAIFALLYNVKRDDLDYILETFNTLKNYELNNYNYFKTKELILNSYDLFSKQRELFV